MNVLTNKLKIDLPIIQAPMAGVSTPVMAAAVSDSGGLGSIAAGALSVEQAEKMIDETRGLTTRPFNVNVFCHKPACVDKAKEQAWLERLEPIFARYSATPPSALHEIYPSFLHNEVMYELLIKKRPAVVSFHFGFPEQAKINELHRAGIILFATATNVIDAQRASNAGIDAIVAQGYEAGGHRGSFDPKTPDEKLTTLDLVKLLIRKIHTPVIAAGGFMNGAGINAALTAGASAVQLGTAFIACPESAADADYRKLLADTTKSQSDQQTVMTSVISGRPARCLNNRFTEFGADVAISDIPDYSTAYSAGKALNAAARAQGESGYAPQWAGTGAPLSRSMPAAQLVALLRSEMQA